MTVRDILMAATESEIAGSAWSAVNIRQPYNSIVWSGSQFVAVGTSILTSSDGVAWKERPTPVADVTLRKVIWSGSQFVAVGTLGTIITSPDGITWTQRASGTTAILNWIVWSGNQFVAVGDGGVILTSANGTTWVSRTSGVSSTLYSIVWSGSQFVIGGSSYTLTSSDGISWTLQSAPPFWQSGNIIIWSGSIYVAGGANNTIWSSTNGINWTQRYTISSNFFTFTDGFWDGSKFLFLGSGLFDIDSKISTSSDGLSWAEYSVPKINCFAKNISTFIGLDDLCYSSTDAITWVDITTEPKNTISGIATNGINQIVAVGSNRNILTSSDGFNWTLRLSSTVPTLNKVVWSGTQYATVGAGGLILTSANGIDWTQRTSDTTLELFDIVWSGSQFVVVGGAGSTAVILTSPDGINWAAATSGVSSPLRGIVWTGSQFVVVGSNGTIITSSNGTSWTQRTSGVSALLTSIAWSGSRYIVTGVTGAFLTSTDSINWSTTSFSGGLTRVFWTGRIFIGVQSYSIVRGPSASTLTTRYRIFTSGDGINWISTNHPSVGVLSALMNFRDRLFLLGQVGSILTSPSINTTALPKL